MNTFFGHRCTLVDHLFGERIVKKPDVDFERRLIDESDILLRATNGQFYQYPVWIKIVSKTATKVPPNE
jgi:hypothetical protein